MSTELRIAPTIPEEVVAATEVIAPSMSLAACRLKRDSEKEEKEGRSAVCFVASEAAQASVETSAASEVAQASSQESEEAEAVSVEALRSTSTTTKKAAVLPTAAATSPIIKMRADLDTPKRAEEADITVEALLVKTTEAIITPISITIQEARKTRLEVVTPAAATEAVATRPLETPSKSESSVDVAEEHLLKPTLCMNESTAPEELRESLSRRFNNQHWLS
jgi:hypothetical protein